MICKMTNTRLKEFVNAMSLEGLAMPIINKGSGDTSNGDIKGRYELMPQANTYALGVEAVRNTATNNPFIQDNGSRIYRPLTFKENIEARVNDYETSKDKDGNERTPEERLRFFNTWLDSSTGIAFKKGSTLFKIINECSELITIDSAFNEAYLPVDYSKLQGNELDSSKGTYNKGLTKEQVIEHESWIAALQGDKSLLKNYAEIVFNVKKGNELMGFYVRSNTGNDELRALCVGSLASDSNAGDRVLGSVARFLRKVAQS